MRDGYQVHKGAANNTLLKQTVFTNNDGSYIYLRDKPITWLPIKLNPS
jgi:hypothetical protein